MLDKLRAIEDKFLYIQDQLSDPEVAADNKRFSKLNKEYKSLKEVVDVYREYDIVLKNLSEAKEMLSDSEMKDMAQEEIKELNPRKTELEDKLKILLIPKDPEDTKDVIFEIRAGTGGDEAAIFSGDLYRMYQKYFDTLGFKFEIIKLNEGTSGGYKEIILEIAGHDVYGTLKFESGAHRVQRVPKTESQGRLHTSAATVVVIPKMELEDIDIKKSDIRMDVFRSSGAGGQHVNRTESGVRLVHIPTNTVSESTDGRSQHKNREIAMGKLVQRIQEARKKAHAAGVAAERKSLVGTGDRSDKIRTYNYPQNRVTDHRLEGDTKNHNLNTVIDGDLSGVIEALKVLENTEKMKASIED